jgi:DNA-binding GntR family transcriptional regulator
MSITHLPLYAQVENVIIDRISDGSLPAGSRLPSEDSLVHEQKGYSPLSQVT